MANKYEMLVNLRPEMKKVYEKYYQSENYEILLNEDTLLLVKKSNKGFRYEQEIASLVSNMVKKYPLDGIVYLDLTTEMNNILQKSEEKDILDLTDNYITWPIRQAITRAISNKNTSRMPK